MTSKKLFIVVLLASVIQLYGQEKTIEFSYDNSGNQTERKICINCSTASKTLNETTAEDFIPIDVNPTDQITYYPNPVQEELYLKWELINDKNKYNDILSGKLKLNQAKGNKDTSDDKDGNDDGNPTEDN